MYKIETDYIWVTLKKVGPAFFKIMTNRLDRMWTIQNFIYHFLIPLISNTAMAQLSEDLKNIAA